MPQPPGMSEFAARWIFGDGAPEGIPIGEDVLARMPEAAGPPSFLHEREEERRTAEEAASARRSQPVPRGHVEEIPAAFRLSGMPPSPRAAAAEQPPSDSAAMAAESVPAVSSGPPAAGPMPPIPAPSEQAPEASAPGVADPAGETSVSAGPEQLHEAPRACPRGSHSLRLAAAKRAGGSRERSAGA